jgi:hypothetical protein
MVALDFEDQYWGDIGQHHRIREFYLALIADGASGEIARALAGIPDQRDGDGNIIVGDTFVSEDVRVRGSVLINARLEGRGEVVSSVLIGTHARDIKAQEAFDILSTALDLTLQPGSGTYKVVSSEPVVAAAGERLTTLFTPAGEVHMRCREDTDLRNRQANYDEPILDNPMSFREAHEVMTAVGPEDVGGWREDKRREVESKI